MGEDLCVRMEALDVGNSRIGCDHRLDAFGCDDDRGRTRPPPHRDRKAGCAKDVRKVLRSDDEETVELMLLDERRQTLLIDYDSDTLFLTCFVRPYQ
jgi:hypothetical protein